MRLADLDPHWTIPKSFPDGTSIHTGLTFECPHCRPSRVGVKFKPAIDPDGLLADTTWIDPPDSYERTGDTFETLTLSPSIRVEGHWHGHIINGDIVP